MNLIAPGFIAGGRASARQGFRRDHRRGEIHWWL